MSVAERLGEKSRAWTILDNVVKLIILPLGVWLISAMVEIKGSIGIIETKISSMKETLDNVVLEETYVIKITDIERRLDAAEKRVEKLEDRR